MSLHISDEKKCEVLFEIAVALSNIYKEKSTDDIFHAIEEYEILSLIDDALNYGLQDD